MSPNETRDTTSQPVAFPQVPRENLATRAAEILKSHILRERLPPGHRLPSERRLADWLNVSRMVLRAAIARLEAEGVLFRPSPRVLAIADFDRAAHAGDLNLTGSISQEQRDLVELRMFLEIGALEQIIARMTPEHEREIERWVIDGERRFAEREPTYPADAKFHVSLLRVVNNSAVSSLLPMIQESMRLYLVSNPYQLTWADEEMAHAIVAEHRQVFEAIRAGDLAAATESMRLHHQRNIDVAEKIGRARE